MTLSEFILEETDDGIDIARVLIDVMNGFIRGVTPSHRLTAARLLTTYGFQDARDFINDNLRQPSDNGRQWVISDPELSRLIRANTNDGQEMCLFLIDVMWGKVEGTRIGHRVSAANELLNRAFGRSQGIPLPNPPRNTAPPGTIPRPDQQIQAETSQEAESAPVHPELVEGQVGHEPSRREPVEGQSAPPTQTQVATVPVRPELVEGQPETNPNFDPNVYRAASKCLDPNFDPMLAAPDEEYWFNYDGCDNISCPFHGDPEDPDYDPNAQHY